MRTDMEIGEEYFCPSWPGKHIQVLHARWVSSVNDYGKKVLGIIYKANHECKENLRVTGREY